MVVTARVLDSWIGLNVRFFCFEGLRGNARRQALESARTSRSQRIRPPTLSIDHSNIRRLDSRNHCAHFVSTVLGLESEWHRFHVPDGNAGPFEPLRVRGIVNQCDRFRRVPDEQVEQMRQGQYPEDNCLIYVIMPGSVSRRGSDILLAYDSAHIGFYDNGRVWHYENDPPAEMVMTYMLNERWIYAEGGTPRPDGGHGGQSRFLDRYGPSSQIWFSDYPRICDRRPITYIEYLQGVEALAIAERRGRRR